MTLARRDARPQLKQPVGAWLVNERLDGEGPEGSWKELAARNADLFAWKPSILDRYYEAATLASDRARRTFVWPDRK